MATDVEESNTDDHDRPAPPKRQRTRLVKANETRWETERPTHKKEETVMETEDAEYDDAEKHSREKLKRWQARQEATGYVDNTINKIRENYFMSPASYCMEDYRLCLFPGNDMEDTAVMMAIRNHGLVQSAGPVSHSNAFYSDQAPGYWTDNITTEVQCSCPPNRVQNVGGIADSSSERNSESNWDAEKADDSNQQEDFLERAVVEAIKKKGLSALSVDYG